MNKKRSYDEVETNVKVSKNSDNKIELFRSMLDSVRRKNHRLRNASTISSLRGTKMFTNLISTENKSYAPGSILLVCYWRKKPSGKDFVLTVAIVVFLHRVVTNNNRAIWYQFGSKFFLADVAMVPLLYLCSVTVSDSTILEEHVKETAINLLQEISILINNPEYSMLLCLKPSLQAQLFTDFYLNGVSLKTLGYGNSVEGKYELKSLKYVVPSVPPPNFKQYLSSFKVYYMSQYYPAREAPLVTRNRRSRNDDSDASSDTTETQEMDDGI